MRILYIAAAGALALSACSEQTEKNAAATAENVGDTVVSAAGDTAVNADAVADTTAAAAKDTAADADAAADTAARQTDAAADAAARPSKTNVTTLPNAFRARRFVFQML